MLLRCVNITSNTMAEGVVSSLLVILLTFLEFNFQECIVKFPKQ